VKTRRKPVDSLSQPSPALWFQQGCLLVLVCLTMACPKPPPPPSPPAPAFDSKAWTRASVAGRENLRTRDLAAAEAAFLRALDESQKLRTSDVRRQVSLSNLENVAEAYWEEGNSEGFARVGDRLAPEIERIRGARAPSLGDLYHRIGQARGGLEEWEKSKAALERATELKAAANPNDPAIADLQVETALARTKLGDFDAAQVEVEEALAYFEAHDSPANKPVSALVVRARAFRESGDFDRAAAALARARRLQVDAQDGRGLDLTVSLEDARLRAARGDLDGADRDFVELIANLDERNPDARLAALLWAEVCELRLQAGDPQGALAAAESGLERADTLGIEKDPRARLQAGRARALRDQGRKESAVAGYEEALKASRRGGPAGRALGPQLEKELGELRGPDAS